MTDVCERLAHLCQYLFKFQFQPVTDLRDFHKHDHQKNTLRRISRAVCGTARKNPQPHERSHFPNICENWRGWKVPCCHLIADKRLHERPNFSALKNCACWCCCVDNASRPTPAALWKCLHQRWSPVSKRLIYLFICNFLSPKRRYGYMTFHKMSLQSSCFFQTVQSYAFDLCRVLPVMAFWF